MLLLHVNINRGCLAKIELYSCSLYIRDTVLAIQKVKQYVTVILLKYKNFMIR